MQEYLKVFAGKFWQLLCGKLIIFTEKFDGICRKILRFFHAGRLDDFYRKIWRFVWENWTIFVERVSFKFSRKIWRFLQKNFTIFVWKVDNFYRKIWRCCRRNLTNSSGKFGYFYKKIWRILHQNLTSFASMRIIVIKNKWTSCK